MLRRLGHLVLRSQCAPPAVQQRQGAMPWCGTLGEQRSFLSLNLVSLWPPGALPTVLILFSELINGSHSWTIRFLLWDQPSGDVSTWTRVALQFL